MFNRGVSRFRILPSLAPMGVALGAAALIVASSVIAPASALAHAESVPQLGTGHVAGYGVLPQLSMTDPDEVPQEVIDAFSAVTEEQIRIAVKDYSDNKYGVDQSFELGEPVNQYLLNEQFGIENLSPEAPEIGGWELQVYYTGQDQYCAPLTVDGNPTRTFVCGDFNGSNADSLFLSMFWELDELEATDEGFNYPSHVVTIRQGLIYADHVTVRPLDSNARSLMGVDSVSEEDFAHAYFNELKERQIIEESYIGSAAPKPLFNASDEQVEIRQHQLDLAQGATPQSAVKRALLVGGGVLLIGLAVLGVAFTVRKKDKDWARN